VNRGITLSTTTLTATEIAAALRKSLPYYTTYRWPIKDAMFTFADALKLEGVQREAFYRACGATIGPTGGSKL
jgi:hypothetical protein